ncbi:MAG: hypothetical protein K2N42_06055 [Anaeroplasmataceae bacterium]|nr:hypothetical protein [Anaeroplasmataceae bacterium]
MKKYLVHIIINTLLALIVLTIFIVWLVTKKSELMYPLGVCTGLFISVFSVTLVSIMIRKKQLVKTHFDERQLKSRGDCYCISFFFLLFCLFIDGLLRTMLDYDWCNYLVGVFTWGMLSIGVFAITAIWKDAYTSEGESKLRLSIFLTVIGLMDTSVGVASILMRDFIIDGQVDVSFVNLSGGIVLLVTAVNLIIKYKIDKRKVFIEDEEFETEVC